MTGRIRLIKLLFFLWSLLLFGRLAYWQVYKASSLDKAAKAQYDSTNIIPAPRGEIRSSDGFPLVTNNAGFMAYVNPQIFKPGFQEQRLLEGLIGSEEGKKAISEIGKVPGLSWFPIAHHISPEIKQALEKLQITGLGFDEEQERAYPEGSPSAYITGFVGKNETGDTEGYFGLEGFYNRTLSGKSGKILQELDAYSKPIVIGNQNLIPSQPGQNLITSIDRTVEYVAWKKLTVGLEKYRARSGTVTIMDSQTGKILAMVSLPGYDPAAYGDVSPELYKNPIISDGYEPGSTFKAIVMASALDAKIVTPNTVCDTCTGPQKISGYFVKSYNDAYYPGSTMTDVILHSDNVGMVFVARKMGREKLLSYIRKFGFGKLTGVDLQEESTPEIKPDSEWQEIDWATASFGQGIAVTRLQMVTAVNVLANRGILIPPRVVTGIESEGKVKILSERPSYRVISSEAASAMTLMMVNGVEKGEVRYYRVPGYTVAGKTGTAQIPIAGNYDPSKFIASFIGFAPVENPKFTMLVTLREPKSSPWGSTTAAPLWFDIAGDLFRYFQIPPKTR